MSKVLAVAWREFKYTAMTKAFIFGAVVIPALLFGLVAFASLLFKPNVTELTGTIVVIDDDGSFTAAAEIETGPDRMNERLADLFAQFGERAAQAAEMATPYLPKVNLTVQSAEPTADLEQLKQQIHDGEIIALAVYPSELIAEDNGIDSASLSEMDNSEEGDEPGTIALYLGSDLAPNHVSLINRTLRTAVVRARTEKQGQDYQELITLLRRPSIQTRTITPEGQEAKSVGELAIFVPMGFMMLLWISTFTSANYLLTTTIEEKSNKVIEVLLSAVSPMQLMTGKILGQALVSVIMLMMYAGLAIVGLVTFSFMHLIPMTYLFYMAAYFVMAYFMISAMMAGIGSAVNDLREAQSLIGPAMLVLMIPLMLWFFIQENPNGTLATVTSFIPPLIPFVMILRVTTPTESVDLWQIIVSLVWGYAAMIGMVWMAAKIFRVGVLMYGKPPTPLELIKWLRYS